MRDADARWVLSFDGSCGSCRAISCAVARACDGRLDVLPLAHPEVRRWRELGLGSPAPWTPTLMRIRGTEVSAWTGTALAVHLVRRLGPRSTVHVVRALGQLRRREGADRSARAPEGSIARARFLQLGAGFVVAAGMLLTGRTPAFAEEECAAARSWVDANMGRLPQRYDDVVAHPVAYRRAIVSALPPRVRSELWVEHLGRCRAAHPELSTAQAEVIDRAAALAAAESTFDPGPGAPAVAARLRALEEAAVRAFGRNQAGALLATLGPAEAPASQPLSLATPGCTCSVDSDYCLNSTVCESYERDCRSSAHGCGTFYNYACDGRCFNA